MTRFARSAPGEAGRPAGQRVGVDFLVKRLAAQVDVQDRLAALGVGRVHRHVAVEAAGPQQGRVQNVGPVGGGDHDDARVGVEAVHLDQQLVQGLLALVVAAAQARAALAAHGVDLVNEDQRRAVGLGGVEQVADAGCADADEHLHEVRAGDVEERHARLAGDGAGQHGLAASGRAEQQDALGDLGAQRLELLGVLQELDDFLQFLLGLVHAGDVVKRDFGDVVGQPLGAGAPKRQGLVAAALRLAQKEHPEEEDHAQRQHERDQHRHDAVRR